MLLSSGGQNNAGEKAIPAGQKFPADEKGLQIWRPPSVCVFVCMIGMVDGNVRSWDESFFTRHGTRRVMRYAGSFAAL